MTTTLPSNSLFSMIGMYFSPRSVILNREG
jgi:hypothetical protein